MMFRQFKDGLVAGEKRIFAELKSAMSLSGQANVLVMEMLKTESVEKIQELNHRIRELEKTGDQASFQMLREISSGALVSGVVDKILELVSLVDDVMDKFYYVSREINRMNFSQVDGISKKDKLFHNSLYKLLILSGDAIQLVSRIFDEGNMKSALSLRSKIKEIEQDGDNVKDNALDDLYLKSKELTYLEFQYYINLHHKIDDILDDCEDISDLVVSIFNSFTK